MAISPCSTPMGGRWTNHTAVANQARARAAGAFFSPGSTPSVRSSGRAITWALTTLPSSEAAAAPASRAALTAATSPLMTALLSALPTFLNGPTNSTLADLSMASTPWTRQARPWVSRSPIASLAMILGLFGLQVWDGWSRPAAAGKFSGELAVHLAGDDRFLVGWNSEHADFRSSR